MTSRLAAALCAAADGLDADQAAAELIISHGAFLEGSEFSRYITTETGISDGTTLALIDWDSAIAVLGRGGLAVSGGERRILLIAASLASGHPVSLRDVIPGLDQRNLHLVTTAIRRAAGDRQ
jgi:hypothetical protein